MVATTIIRIQANVAWQCQLGEGGHWVGVCDPLRLTVQADTWADLMEDIGLSIDAMMKDLLQSGELVKFLRQHGWEPVGAIPHPVPKAIERLRFDMPFIAHQVASRDSQRILHQ